MLFQISLFQLSPENSPLSSRPPSNCFSMVFKLSSPSSPTSLPPLYCNLSLLPKFPSAFLSPSSKRISPKYLHSLSNKNTTTFCQNTLLHNGFSFFFFRIFLTGVSSSLVLLSTILILWQPSMKWHVSLQDCYTWQEITCRKTSPKWGSTDNFKLSFSISKLLLLLFLFYH